MQQYFSKMPEAELRTLLCNCPNTITQSFTLSTYSSGALICQQGDPAEFCYILLSGLVKAEMICESGKIYLVDTYVPGNMFCHAEILNESLLLSNVIAVETSTIIRISRDALSKWMRADSNFTFFLLRGLARKWQCSTIKLANTTATLKYQLLHWLVTKNISHITMEKEEIAEKFGVTLRSINRIVGELEVKGIILYEHNTLRIISSDLLKAEMQGIESK
jgi:CRP-like cAMP-binding protein